MNIDYQEVSVEEILTVAQETFTDVDHVVMLYKALVTNNHRRDIIKFLKSFFNICRINIPNDMSKSDVVTRFIQFISTGVVDARDLLRLELDLRFVLEKPLPNGVDYSKIPFSIIYREIVDRRSGEVPITRSDEMILKKTKCCLTGILGKYYEKNICTFDVVSDVEFCPVLQMQN